MALSWTFVYQENSRRCQNFLMVFYIKRYRFALLYLTMIKSNFSNSMPRNTNV